ncbi:metal ABC transporter ATP-binding protein [Methylopila sp. M107]|uniref:metal ABC transporter ATP-binding protein n=1 Tax=Methylopila sp. M107 TaxID=1101190 RepID=UPI000371199A|nr:metal ABC transporter ATP-binding protein [Methylopila sp. M107]
MSGPAVSFSGVGLTLGRTEILRGVTIEVAAGAVHAIVGPNGGGKSSLVRALLGQAPHSGEIALDWLGREGVTAYVPQALDFDRGLPMTVLDVLAAMTARRPAFLKPSPRDRGQILDALARVGMAEKAGRLVGALSGGERQRALMAQALIPEPDLVVLDEPMAALDEAGVAVFEQLIGELSARGATVIWIEHDLAAVRRLATRVTGLNRSVLFDGAPEQELTPERLLTLFSHHPKAETADGGRFVPLRRAGHTP